MLLSDLIKDKCSDYSFFNCEIKARLSRSEKNYKLKESTSLQFSHEKISANLHLSSFFGYVSTKRQRCYFTSVVSSCDFIFKISF